MLTLFSIPKLMLARYLFKILITGLCCWGCVSHDLDEPLRDVLNCATEVSFANEVKITIAANCSVPTCHNGSLGASLDFRTFDNIQSRSERIVSFVKAGAMPPAGSGLSLSEAEVTTISCWVFQGSKNN